MGNVRSCVSDRYFEDKPEDRPRNDIVLYNENQDPDSRQASGDSPWKIWRHFSSRHGKERRENKKDDKKTVCDQPNVTKITQTEAVEVIIESLPDVVEKTVIRRSQSFKPAPPKPPRLFLFRSSSINNPKTSVVNDTVHTGVTESQTTATVGVHAFENLPPVFEIASGTDANSPKNMSNQNHVESITEETEETEVKDEIDNRVAISLMNIYPKVCKIKIVTPDLSSKRVPVKPRKRSGDISESNRHRQILMSATELICQKFNPEPLLQSLFCKEVITAGDLQAYKGHPDRQLICESLVHTISEGQYSQFIAFCDILKTSSQYEIIGVILDAMKDAYNVLCDIPSQTSEDVQLLDDEKSISFEVGYYSSETGVMKPIVELEKSRADNRRLSRELCSLHKGNSGLSSHFLGNEMVNTVNNSPVSTQLNGSPVLNISISGHRLHGDRAKALSSVLDKYTCIHELHVGKTQLCGDDINALLLPLHKNSRIAVLDVRLNSIGSTGAAILADTLQGGSTLKTLNLSSTGLDSDGCKYIAEALKSNCNLSELDLSFIDIGDSGCISLGKMFKINKTITKLRLRSVNMSWIGCGFLFEGVQQSVSLTDLDLSRNFIGDSGIDMICRHLNDASTLTDLNLENCGITAAGCSLLGKMIAPNKSLENLNLSVNCIGDAGISKLFPSLESNKQIRTLGLNMCKITNDGFSKLLDILECNQTLTTVKLCYNHLGREDRNQKTASDDLKYRVQRLTASNPKLKILLWGNTIEDFI